jgi:hypothetical protein
MLSGVLGSLRKYSSSGVVNMRQPRSSVVLAIMMQVIINQPCRLCICWPHGRFRQQRGLATDHVQLQQCPCNCTWQHSWHSFVQTQPSNKSQAATVLEGALAWVWSWHLGKHLLVNSRVTRHRSKQHHSMLSLQHC